MSDQPSRDPRELQARPEAATVQARAPSPVILDLPELPVVYDRPARDISGWDPARQDTVKRIVDQTPRLDGRAVNGFGIEPQRRANRFLDELLEGLRTDDIGSAGALVAELATGVKMLDLPGLKREAAGHHGVVARLMPSVATAERGLMGMIGGWVSAFQRFRNNQKAILAHLQRIEDQGRRQMAALDAMDAKLDRLVEENLASMRYLEEYVVAGGVILERERARYARARTAALASRDPARLASVRDWGEQINGFETRLLALDAAVADAMLDVPQTRLSQSAGRIQYRNVADTLLFDMPALKRAVLRVAALKNIGEAERANTARRALRRQVEGIGIDALETAYEAAKRTESGALAEVEAMATIADRVLGIIEKGADIDTQNHTSREAARRRLEGVRETFVRRLGETTARAVEYHPA